MRTLDEASADMEARGLVFGFDWTFELRARYDKGCEYEVYRFTQEGRECVEVVETMF